MDIPSVDPKNSAFARRPYKTIENAKESIAKNISLYFLNIKPRAKPNKPAATTAIKNLKNIVFYGNSNYRSANHELTIKWNDSKLNINWPKCKKIISKKDLNGISVADVKI